MNQGGRSGDLMKREKIVGDKGCDATCKNKQNQMDAFTITFIMKRILTEVASPEVD